RLDDDLGGIIGEETSAPAAVSGPDNLAYVIYTSGSTGRPKGVMVAHTAVVNFMTAMAGELSVSSDDVLMAVTPVSFDIAGLELFLPLLAGGRIVLASQAMTQDGRALGERLAEVGATMLQATPASWRMLLEIGWRSDGVKALCGGEALAPDLAAWLVSSTATAWNLYGPTETTIWSTARRLGAGMEVTIGRPIANTQVHVLDREGRPAGVGIAGELYIGGAGLARG
ncbi:AMP-binding protein, partial [Bradyrhizobium sp. PRIMUS42]